jgi:hypothetical protein
MQTARIGIFFFWRVHQVAVKSLSKGRKIRPKTTRKSQSPSDARQVKKSKLRSDSLIEIAGLPPRLRARFRQLTEVANTALEGLQRRDKRSPQDQPWSLFKIAVYDHVLLQIKDGRLKQIWDVVRTSPFAPVSVEFKEIPFHWALFALSKSADFEEYEKLCEEKIYEYGLQLCYAFNHKIPPALLIGFLYQTQITSSIKRNLVRHDPTLKESWFNEYLEWLRGRESVDKC